VELEPSQTDSGGHSLAQSHKKRLPEPEENPCQTDPLSLPGITNMAPYVQILTRQAPERADQMVGTTLSSPTMREIRDGPAPFFFVKKKSGTGR
jgi:hypothetical protein